MFHLDAHREDTTVETLLRRIQQRMRQSRRTHIGDTEPPLDDGVDFDNLHLDPDLYFMLDYASRIYDPRTVPGNTRFYRLKSLFMRLMRLYTTRQVEFNATLLRIVHRLFDLFQDSIERFSYFRDAELRLQRRMERAENAHGQLARWLDGQRERIERIEDDDRSLDRRLRSLEDLHNRLRDASAENAVLRQRLETLMRRVAMGASPAASPASAGDAADSAADDYLYFPCFNEERGTEQDIRDKLRSYVRLFAEQNGSWSADANILDAGCGRGEFLDLCRAASLPASGVDINGDMVAHCKAKGLAVAQTPVLKHLASLPDTSLRGIMACHVLEHFPPHEQLAFVKLAVLKLAPGGIIVVETPNPQTVFALTQFYRDPTHQRPVSPDTLRLLFEKLGMRNVAYRTAAMVPQEFRLRTCNDPVLDENIDKLNDFLFGALDYALIATK